MKNTGDALRVADGVIEQRIAAVWANVVEAAHLQVIAAHNDQWRSSRVMESAIVERARNFRLMTGDDPALVEDFFLLLAKYRVVRINTRIYEMRSRQLGLLQPLCCVARHIASGFVNYTRASAFRQRVIAAGAHFSFQSRR